MWERVVSTLKQEVLSVSTRVAQNGIGEKDNTSAENILLLRGFRLERLHGVQRGPAKIFR